MPLSEPGPIWESSNLKVIDYSTWGQCHLKQVVCQKCCDLYFTNKSKMLNSGIRALLFFPGNGDYRKWFMPTFTSAVNIKMAVWSVRALRLCDTTSFFYGKRTDHRRNLASLMMYLPGYKSLGRGMHIHLSLSLFWLLIQYYVLLGKSWRNHTEKSSLILCCKWGIWVVCCWVTCPPSHDQSFSEEWVSFIKEMKVQALVELRRRPFIIVWLHIKYFYAYRTFNKQIK